MNKIPVAEKPADDTSVLCHVILRHLETGLSVHETMQPWFEEEACPEYARGRGLLEALDRGLVLEATDLRHCYFQDTGIPAGKSLARSDLSGDYISNVCFERSNLTGVNFAAGEIVNTSFREADLSSANFDHAILVHCDLSKADIAGASFAGARLKGTKFMGRRLRHNPVQMDFRGLRVVIFDRHMLVNHRLNTIANWGRATSIRMKRWFGYEPARVWEDYRNAIFDLAQPAGPGGR